MKIILDSNIIIADFRLLKKDSVLFLRNHNQAGYKCYVSQITLNEVLVNFRKHLKQKIDSFNSSVNSLNKQITFNKEIIDEDFLEKEIETYKEIILTKFKLHNISIIPIPEVPHEKILKHLFARKHPFDSKDNGYKDFLIYYSLLEIIEKSKTDVIFISNDNDFGNMDLHPDLKELNESKHSIILRKSLKELNEKELSEQIRISTAKLAFIIDVFNDDRHQEEYINTVIDSLESEDIEIFPDFIYDSVDVMDTPSLDEVHFERDSGKIVSVNPISEDITIVEFSLHSYLSYLFTINSSNNYQLQNFHDDFTIQKTHEGYNTFVELGYWFRLNIKVQADMNGNNLTFYEIEIIK